MQEAIAIAISPGGVLAGRLCNGILHGYLRVTRVVQVHSEMDRLPL